MGTEEKDQLAKFREAFKEELVGITDIEELKELFATEIARRDRLIQELRDQNQVILKSSMRSREQEITGR